MAKTWLLVTCVALNCFPSSAFALDAALVSKLKNKPWAQKEVDRHVQACGEGVIEGQSGENRCSYTVPVDAWLLKPTAEKTGLLHDDNWPYEKGVVMYQPPEIKAEDLPESFDLRDLMTGGQPKIKTQNCGDCWAWSTHHALEIARAVHDLEVVDNSVQTVLSCSGAGSCNGGYMSAPQFLVGRGLPLESDFPYAGYDKRCPFNTSSMKTGWEGKVMDAPYIGSSLNYSRAVYPQENYADGNKVTNMMKAMYQWKAPLVVTVAAYSAGPGIVDSCSSINSQGNHMVAIVGWETWKGKRVAHVWNSWGKNHGTDGVSKIVWECGSGKLNRGLGYEARVVQYKEPSLGCDLPKANVGNSQYSLRPGESIILGAAAYLNQTCKWTPSEGLKNPNACVTTATPSKTTEYHLQATNPCGTTSAMTLVEVATTTSSSKKKRTVLTPHGEVAY